MTAVVPPAIGFWPERRRRQNMERQLVEFRDVIGCVGIGNVKQDVVRGGVENMADVHPQLVE